MDLNSFINSPIRNAHIEDFRFTTLYCRKSTHYIKGVFVPGVFDIGSIATMYPGTGQFTEFLGELLAAWNGPIFVENVMTERFALYLERIGFERVYDDCFILWGNV